MGRKKKPQAELKAPEPLVSQPVTVTKDPSIVLAPTKPAKQMYGYTHSFNVSILAGMSMRDHARREQEEIEREFRRRGIAHVDIIRVMRGCNAGPSGRKESNIIVNYQKEEIVKE